MDVPSAQSDSNNPNPCLTLSISGMQLLIVAQFDFSFVSWVLVFTEWMNIIGVHVSA